MSAANSIYFPKAIGVEKSFKYDVSHGFRVLIALKMLSLDGIILPVFCMQLCKL